MGTRILITGGAGYVGSHCVKHLLERGDYDVLVYDDLSTGHRAAVPGCEVVVADLGDVGTLQEAVSRFRPQAVMHFAAHVRPGESTRQPLKYYRNNVANTISLLDVMKRHGVRRLVFSSSCAVYGNPPAAPVVESMPKSPVSPYGRTKLMAEEVMADCASGWGLGFAALRYFNAAGAAADGTIGEDHDPEVHLIPIAIRAAMGGRPNMEIFGTDYDTPDGTCIRDYVHVDDLAAAHRLALGNLAEGSALTCNLGTGRGHSVREIIQTVKEVSGRDFAVVETERRAGDPAAQYADPSLARDALGWRARITDVRRIVASAWKWHSTHPDGFEDRRARNPGQ